MNQYTLNQEYHFNGKGLHSGVITNMTLCPAPINYGVRFLRTDCNVEIEAIASNVTRVERSTTLSKDGIEVITVEHLLSALTGLGVDNVLIKIDNKEVPILDGSSLPYVNAIMSDGLCEQDAPRNYLTIDKEIEVRNDRTGSVITISPSDKFSVEVETDFNSRVLGVQKASWSEDEDYINQIAPCRTFVFFHELEALASLGLVKGGDVDNAIVVIEHPVSDEQVERMCSIFNQEALDVTPEGYLSNLKLRFNNECGRHKLLDLLGDIRLAGGFPKVKIVAYKPGHTINTNAAKSILAVL